MKKKRVVVTGCGVVVPGAIDSSVFWNNLCHGTSSISSIDRFDPVGLKSQVAGVISDDNLSIVDDFFGPKKSKRMDIFSKLGVYAADEAIRDAGLDLEKEDPFCMGVIMGNGIGGVTTLSQGCLDIFKTSVRRTSPYLVIKSISNMASAEIAMKYSLQGYNLTVSSACASSSHAVGESFKMLQSGRVDVMCCGGTESSITPVTVSGFDKMGALATGFNDNPLVASRPFDRTRSGFVIGEGAGVLILETEEHALARDAKIHAEVFGYGTTSDAYHVSAPDPTGIPQSRAMQSALDDATLVPEDIDYVNAHGTSTEYNDKFETNAIKKVFGDYAYEVPISSTKSMIGHLLGASGSVELIASVFSVQHDRIHPTINVSTPDPECDLDYVTEGEKKKDVVYAMSNSFGFGGHNSVLIVGKYK